MRITPAATPAAPSSNPDAFELRTGERLPAAFVGSTPEGRAMQAHVSDLFAFMGVRSVGYNRVTHPGTLRVSFSDYDFAKLADNTLRDAVLGVKLVFMGPDGAEYDMTKPGAQWTDVASNAAKSVAAMPGVVSYSNSEGSIIFRVEDAQVRDALKGLVNDQLNGAGAIWTLAHRTPPA